MNDENDLKRQDETETAVAENLLTYADLLQIEWILDDKIDEWKWRDDGLENLIEKGHATLGRIREMIRKDEASEREEATHPVKLTLGMHVETYAAAERLTRRRCQQGLPQTLIDLASDMAECETRPGSWEAQQVDNWMESHYPPLEVPQCGREGGES